MANDFLDACVYTVASTGTGAFVAASAEVGFRTPAQAGAQDGKSYRYRAQNPLDLTEWEIGQGPYNSGTGALTRFSILASSTGGTVNFSNPPIVTITAAAADHVFQSNLLDSIKAVDGVGSGLDAELLAGFPASYYTLTSSLVGTISMANQEPRVVGEQVTDWNDALANGFYWGNGTAANSPGAGTYYGDVRRYPGSGNTEQVLRISDNTDYIYRRVNDAGTGNWSAWERVYWSQSQLDGRYLVTASFNDSYHGDRGGGTLHAAVTTSVNGFMTAADKTKLNGIMPGADVTSSGNVGFAISSVSTKSNLSDTDKIALFDSALKTITWANFRDNHLATTINNGFMSSSDKTKLDGIEAAADVTDAANVGSSIAGTATKVTPVDADSLALIDSAASNALKRLTFANLKSGVFSGFGDSQHGSRGGGTLHNAATTSVAGFMSAPDKTKLDGLVSFPEAPTDGGYYVRQSSAWAALPAKQGTGQILVNPLMALSQEAGFTSVTANSTSPCDGITLQYSGITGISAITGASATVYPYFTRITFGTAKASLAVGDYGGFYWKLEGSQLLGAVSGASNGLGRRLIVQIVLAVSVPGTYSVSLRDQPITYSWLGTFTAPDTNVNTYTFVIPTSTLPTFAEDNSYAATLAITPACGTTFGNGVLGWQSGNKIAVAGQTNLAATAGATLAVYTIGMWVDVNGDGLPPAPGSWGTDLQFELARAQRYYIPGLVTMFSSSVTNAIVYYTKTDYPVQMRGTPALSGTQISSFGFPTTTGTLTAYGGNNSFRESRTANTTTAGGFFQSTVIADARL